MNASSNIVAVSPHTHTHAHLVYLPWHFDKRRNEFRPPEILLPPPARLRQRGSKAGRQAGQPKLPWQILVAYQAETLHITKQTHDDAGDDRLRIKIKRVFPFFTSFNI